MSRVLKALAFLLLALLPVAARAQYRVVHLEKPYNTPGSETGAVVVGDTVLAYASLQQQPTRNRQFSVNTQHMQVYQARISKSGKVARPRLSRWGLNHPDYHTGNLCLDPLSHDLYFTRCDIGDPDLRCDIYYARKRRRGWDKPVRLRGSVNLAGYTATQPTVGRLPDSTTVLYFASDRPGGTGGMDLWYAIVKNGRTVGDPVNLGPNVNSPYDDITPFYDQRNQVLYFSSDRPGGMGGHDIYYADGARNAWQPARPVCHCLNSEQNDLYFSIAAYDTATGLPLMGYMASNRPDSYFLVDSTCCNDLYRWTLDTALLASRPPQIDTLESIDTIAHRVRHFMFPLFLYFHNDDPDPASRLATTATSYSLCQQRYAALRDDYLAHQASATDSALVAHFFDTCVAGNYARVEQLFDYVESLLDDGHRITLTIAGYASPAFRSDYNRTLSERRIGSFLNLVRTWHSGTLGEAIEEGSLRIVQQPHGAVEPTTASRSADPVYGLPAMLARRIEILSCDIE